MLMNETVSRDFFKNQFSLLNGAISKFSNIRNSSTHHQPTRESKNFDLPVSFSVGFPYVLLLCRSQAQTNTLLLLNKAECSKLNIILTKNIRLF